MEDVIILILTAAVMIGGAVSSVYKKKKEREAAAGKVMRHDASEEEAPDRKFVRKSLGEVLEELANQQGQPQKSKIVVLQDDDVQDDYYAREMALREDNERAAERLRAMTYMSAETTPRRIAEPPVVVTQDEQQVDADQQNTMSGVLGERFDLRRAIIESEILKPKFEQY